MKKVFFRFITFLFLLSLTTAFFACSSGEPSKKNAEAISKQHVNFDLTQYESHGDLSCGLIWVERTTSSYDSAPTTKFAYLDANGNLKSEWLDPSTWKPTDFSNGLLCLRTRKLYPVYADVFTPPYSQVKCRVYDTEFNIIAVLDCNVNEYYHDGWNTEISITDANERGEIYAFGTYNNESGLFLINKSGIKRFNITKKNLVYDTLSNLKRIKFENDRYIVDLRSDFNNYPSYYGIFDKDANVIFEPSESVPYTVYKCEIISDNEFDVEFRGRDSKLYWVKTDREGNFLSEPRPNS